MYISDDSKKRVNNAGNREAGQFGNGDYYKRHGNPNVQKQDRAFADKRRGGGGGRGVMTSGSAPQRNAQQQHHIGAWQRDFARGHQQQDNSASMGDFDYSQGFRADGCYWAMDPSQWMTMEGNMGGSPANMYPGYGQYFQGQGTGMPQVENSQQAYINQMQRNLQYNKQLMQSGMTPSMSDIMLQQQFAYQVQQQMMGYPQAPGGMLPQNMTQNMMMMSGEQFNSGSGPGQQVFREDNRYGGDSAGQGERYDKGYEHKNHNCHDSEHHGRRDMAPNGVAGGNHKMRKGEEMKDQELERASSPMLTRIIVDMLREAEEGKTRAWHFFERLCQLNKADVYQYSVMLNACIDSWAAEKLIEKMQNAGVPASEVTLQKLYKIFLRDARVEEADEVLKKLDKLMDADNNSRLPDDYTNRVLTDMLLEMVKGGNNAEQRAWELFNKLRRAGKVNIIHYNVMLNTCENTKDAVKLIQEARKADITPSDRTCLKLAKMYMKEGNMPTTPAQLEAVVKGLKKMSLFSGDLTEEDFEAITPEELFSEISDDVAKHKLEQQPSGDVAPKYIPLENQDINKIHDQNQTAAVIKHTGKGADDVLKASAIPNRSVVAGPKEVRD